jgi:hypothetical protein
MNTAASPMTPALTARRWALVAAPVVAGALTIVGVLADPAPHAQGRELVEAYAANPGPLQIKALGYHFAYTVWAAAALGLAALVRRRGSWLANVAGVLAILGISSIPGFLMGDFVDSAMGQLVGVDAAVQVGEAAAQQWGFIVMQGSGFAGLLLALPLAAVAAWRAGLMPWWVAAVVVVGEGAFLGLGVTLPGNILFTAALGVLSFAIARMDLDAGQMPRAAVEGALVAS